MDRDIECVSDELTRSIRVHSPVNIMSLDRNSDLLTQSNHIRSSMNRDNLQIDVDHNVTDAEPDIRYVSGRKYKGRYYHIQQRSLINSPHPNESKLYPSYSRSGLGQESEMFKINQSNLVPLFKNKREIGISLGESKSRISLPDLPSINDVKHFNDEPLKRVKQRRRTMSEDRNSKPYIDYEIKTEIKSSDPNRRGKTYKRVKSYNESDENQISIKNENLNVKTRQQKSNNYRLQNNINTFFRARKRNLDNYLRLGEARTNQVHTIQTGNNKVSRMSFKLKAKNKNRQKVYLPKHLDIGDISEHSDPEFSSDVTGSSEDEIKECIVIESGSQKIQTGNNKVSRMSFKLKAKNETRQKVYLPKQLDIDDISEHSDLEFSSDVTGSSEDEIEECIVIESESLSEKKTPTSYETKMKRQRQPEFIGTLEANQDYHSEHKLLPKHQECEISVKVALCNTDALNSSCDIKSVTPKHTVKKRILTMKNVYKSHWVLPTTGEHIYDISVLPEHSELMKHDAQIKLSQKKPPVLNNLTTGNMMTSTYIGKQQLPKEYPTCADIKLFENYIILSVGERMTSNTQKQNFKICKICRDSINTLSTVSLPGAGQMCKIENSAAIGVLRAQSYIAVICTEGDLYIKYKIKIHKPYSSICHIGTYYIREDKSYKYRFAVAYFESIKGVYVEKIDVVSTDCSHNRLGRHLRLENIVVESTLAKDMLVGISDVGTFTTQEVVVGCSYGLACLNRGTQTLKWQVKTKKAVTGLCCADGICYACVQDENRIMAVDSNGEIKATNILPKSLKMKVNKTTIHKDKMLVKEFDCNDWKNFQKEEFIVETKESYDDVIQEERNLRLDNKRLDQSTASANISTGEKDDKHAIPGPDYRQKTILQKSKVAVTEAMLNTCVDLEIKGGTPRVNSANLANMDRSLAK